MEIRVLRAGCSLALAGRLGSATVGEVRAALGNAIDSGVEDLLVDLREVELVDATGLGVLVGSHRRAERAGRRLVLRNVPERIDRLIVATRLHRVLTVDRPVVGDVA